MMTSNETERQHREEKRKAEKYEAEEKRKKKLEEEEKFLKENEKVFLSELQSETEELEGQTRRCSLAPSLCIYGEGTGGGGQKGRGFPAQGEAG